MKAHTSQFKENIAKFGRELDSKITYTLNNEEVELGSGQLNSITPHYEGAILKSVMKQLDIDSNVEIPLGTILRYQFGVKVGNEYEYIDYGNYVVYSVEKQEDTYSYKITCYDKMLYAMKDYENSNITFPITIKDYLEAICEKVGLEYEGSQFANSDKVIDNELYLDNEGRSLEYTFRDVLDEIAQVSGGTICINNEDKLEVRYIHDVGELQTLTGSSLTLETDDAIKLDSFELEGKTTQENDLILTNFEQGSSLDNNATTRIRSKEIFKITKGKTYKLTWEGTNASSYQMIFNTSLNKSSYLFSTPIDVCGNSAGWSTTSPIQFTATNDGYLAVIVSYRNGAPITPSDVTNLKITLVDFMPSPDYPSELVSVGYENLIDYSNYSGGQINFENNTITSLTTSTTNFTIKELEIGDKYTISCKSHNYYQIAIVDNNNGGTWITYGTLSSGNEFTFTANTDIAIIRLICSSQNNSVSELQLTKGTQTHSYIPYGKYGIEVKTQGKNLLNNTATSQTINGVTFTVNEDKSVLVNGTSTDIIRFEMITLPQIILSSGTYTLTGCPSGGSNSTYKLDITANGYHDDKGNGITFSVNNGTAISSARILIYSGVTVNNLLFKPMLTLSSNTATDYEEYKSNTYLYILDNPLRSIGDTKDLLYIKNGMLYVERKIGSVVLNGSESGWTYSSGVSGFYIEHHLSYRPANALSTNYVFETTNTTWTSNGKFGWNSSGTLWVKDNRFNSSNAFKSWLSSNNVEVNYILQTPYTEELGQVDMPSTYEGITYLDAPNTMNVSYISEFEEIDEEYLKDVNVNFGEKFGAVNTIVLSRGGDGDKIALSNPTDLADEDKISIQITDNQIMNGNNRADFMQPILSQLYGLEYYINDFSSTGICYLDLCDRYRIKIGDNSYKCIMFNDEVDITQGLVELIYTDMQEENEQEYKYIGSTDRGITQANIIANKADATISSFTQQLDATNNRLNSVEVKQTATDETINIISTNIDANGNITEVTTTTGFTFNADGMTIADNQTNFSALHRNTGTYYYAGDTIVGQYTKDGSKQKDLELFGVYYYGKNYLPDDPMFVAQLYTDENGEEAFGHFYNRGD